MGHWNYRLCKETVREYDGEPVSYYSIREAYYNDDGSIWAVTGNEVGLGFDRYSFETEDPIDTARQSLNWMLAALEKPILDLDTIEYAPQQSIEDDDLAEVVDFEEDLGVDSE